MNAKKTTSPFPPAPLLKNKQQQQQQKSGKELTAGLEDSTPYAYYLGGAVTSTTKFYEKVFQTI